jgi:hypothetical protein
MCAARVAQAVEHDRRVRDDPPAALHLAVEDAERIPLEATVAVGAEGGEMRRAERTQPLAIHRAAHRIADGVELEMRLPRPHVSEIAGEHHEQLGVDERIVAPERLDPDLMELAVPAALRTLAAEHRPAIVEPRRRIPLREPALEIGAHDPAVASGRSVSDVPSRSTNEYISFSTMSVVSPIERAKSSVRSTIGRPISSKPYRPKTRAAASSRRRHRRVSSGRTSRKPLTALIVPGVDMRWE